MVKHFHCLTSEVATENKSRFVFVSICKRSVKIQKASAQRERLNYDNLPFIKILYLYEKSVLGLHWTAAWPWSLWIHSNAGLHLYSVRFFAVGIAGAAAEIVIVSDTTTNPTTNCFGTCCVCFIFIISYGRRRDRRTLFYFISHLAFSSLVAVTTRTLLVSNLANKVLRSMLFCSLCSSFVNA